MILHNNLAPRNALMRMLTCHLSAQNKWKVKIVAVLAVHGNTVHTAMCDQDGATYLLRLTAIHGKTEVKKTVNHAVIRKGMLDREFLWLCPTLSVEVN